MGRGGKEFKREDIIDAIVKMRIEKMASTATIIQWIKDEFGYKTTYTYELYKEARKKIVELQTLNNLAHLQESISQLEELLEDAKRKKDNRLALDIRKELSKLQGHYTQKVEVSGNVGLQPIKIVFGRDDEDDQITPSE